MKICPDRKRALFYAMLRIRRVQEAIEARYLEDEMKTPVHLCIGQEAVAVGVCAALRPDDFISSNHRGHGHYLAKGGDLNNMLAELHCREGGCSRGYGGSMHLIDPSVGNLGSSSIVGGGIPIGTGIGLSLAMQGRDAVSVVFFGDGAADEGVLYESINFAMLKKLPVIFVLENNQWSVCSPVSRRQAGPNIFHNAPQDALMTRVIDGNDVRAVYETACSAVQRAREKQGPAFIECETYRILGHAGAAGQDAKGYRDPGEVDHWKARCPVRSFQALLEKEGLIDPAEITAMQTRIDSEIEAAFAYALHSPVAAAAAAPETLSQHLYCE